MGEEPRGKASVKTTGSPFHVLRWANLPPGGRKALDALYSLCAFLPELFALTSLAIILRLLTSLKQVCDHPRVYDKESPERAELSELGDDELQEIFGGKGGS